MHNPFVQNYCDFAVQALQLAVPASVKSPDLNFAATATTHRANTHICGESLITAKKLIGYNLETG